MRARLLIRKIHKYLGLILGLQILLWFLSGFLMSFMPINEIRGDHLLSAPMSLEVDVSSLDLSKLEMQLAEPLLGVEVKPWLDQTVVLATTASGIHRFDSNNEKLPPLSESSVRELMVNTLKPGFTLLSIQRLEEVPAEARGRKAPLWQVQLGGDENARIYVYEQTGEIVAKRTNRWRLFDFMWMLHIMDYDERSDFNHPLLYLTALSALLFTLSGFVLLYFSLMKRKKHRN